MNNITKIDNLKIISKDNDKICIKKNNDRNILNKYKYLKVKDFNNFIDTRIINGYEIRKYVDETKVSNEDKINELIYIISLLHTKTTHYKNISINNIKKQYEKLTDEIIEVKNYYDKLCDDNDYLLFIKPSMFLLIKNISIVLISLDKSKYYLDKWYEIIKDKLRKRVVMNHNNLKISNFILGDIPYLINWDKSIIDSPIYDLVSLFQNNYNDLDMIDIFEIYKSKYNLYDEEKYLLYSLLLKVDKLKLNKNELLNTREVYNLVRYLEKINDFLKYNMK